MDIYLVKERDYIPGILFDNKKGLFKITGKACPEDLAEFYGPVFMWLEEYSKAPNQTTTLEIKLIYYNTASSKALLKILQILEGIHLRGFTVKVKWYYESYDEELLIAGEDYAELLKIPFEFIII